MHYDIPKHIVEPKEGERPIHEDIKRNHVLSSKDKMTVIYAYPKPIGDYVSCQFLCMCVPERHSKRIAFPAPQFSIPRILMGIKSMSVAFTSKANPSLLPWSQAVYQTGLELSFTAEYLKGSVTFSYLTVDPLTLGSYVCPAILSKKTGLHAPCYQKTKPNLELHDTAGITDGKQYVRVNHLSPFDDEANVKPTKLRQLLADGITSPTEFTVIVWINGIKLDESQTTGRVSIDKNFTRSTMGLYSSATVEGCIAEATFSYMAFSKRAINIFGGTEEWNSSMHREWEYLSIPRTQFRGEKIWIIAGISQLRIQKPSSEQHGLRFNVQVDSTPSKLREDGENDMHRWRVITAPDNNFLVSLRFDWVAVTQRLLFKLKAQKLGTERGAVK